MQIVEVGDDYYEPRFSNGSMSCLFLSTLSCIDSQPRNSLSYNKLPPRPLRLTILKLDGSSFGIKVAKTGTVRELKRAVEEAFHDFPKKGPSKISWAHVWGQFCLCHNGLKLLTDSDYIVVYGIKDGDQLQFTHHDSNSYNLVRAQIKKEDSDSDDELNSDGYKGRQQNGEKDDIHRGENLEDNQENDMELDNGISSACEHRKTHLLWGWFSYRKLTSSRIRTEEHSSSRFSNKVRRNFKNIFQSYSNKNDSRKETLEAE